MQLVFMKKKKKECILYLKTIIKKMLSRNIRLSILVNLYRNRNDKKYLNLMDKTNKNPNVLDFYKYGDENKDKVIYFINVISKNKIGFWGLFFEALAGISEAKRWGFIPVVKYDEDCMYQENHKVLGTMNVFEYYYKQPKNISLKSCLNSDRVALYQKFHMHHLYKDMNPYNSTEEDLKKFSSLYKEYFILNDYTQNYISKGIKMLLGNNNRILGLHVRGTDFNLSWKGHPNAIKEDEFFLEIDNVLREYNFNLIFIATDDEHKLNSFIKKYGNKLLYYKDVHRGTGTINVSYEKCDRKNNKYLNGLEVLRDAYTLSMCTGFIAGKSNVAMAARIIKYSCNSRFEYLKILDKGLYI